MGIENIIGVACLIGCVISFLLYQRFSVYTRITPEGRLI